MFSTILRNGLRNGMRSNVPRSQQPIFLVLSRPASTNVSDVLLNDFTPSGLNDKVKQALSLRNASRKDLVKFQKKVRGGEEQRTGGAAGAKRQQYTAFLS